MVLAKFVHLLVKPCVKALSVRISLRTEAAKRARIEIAKATEQGEGTLVAEPTIKLVETVHDLWQAFGWSQATKKKLIVLFVYRYLTV